MSRIILWTQHHCPLCEEVKKKLAGQEYEEKNAGDLILGEEQNEEALVQLAMQDMQLPLIMIDGKFIDVAEFLSTAEAA